MIHSWQDGYVKVRSGRTTLVSKLPSLLLGPARQAPDSSKSALSVSHPTIHTVSVTLGCSASSRAYTKMTSSAVRARGRPDCATCMSLRDLLSLASTPSSYDTAEQSDHGYTSYNAAQAYTGISLQSVLYLQLSVCVHCLLQSKP